jgi:hypothetical protein
MKCSDLSTDFTRCKKGIPVARLFRHYFCEGDHNRCPVKKCEDTHRRLPGGRRFSHFWIAESGS